MSKTLSELMDFDHVVQVLADGTVIDAPDTVYAPEMYGAGLEGDGSGWTLIRGYSGQSGYAGPSMHSSEVIGGGLERDILASPGYYVALVDYWDSEDGDSEADSTFEAVGWAVAFRSAE